MRAKSLILLLVALGCGMIAAVAVSKTVMVKDAAPAPEATVEIFVAVKDIASTQQISAENVKLERWPKNRLPEGALVNLDQLEGKFANQMIFANEPILQKKVSDQRDSFATQIPPGYRVFDIECSASYIKPGDHVDIMGTFKPRRRNAPQETRSVLRNITVCGINGITTRDSDAIKGGKGTIFQLLVKDSQLEALTTAKSTGTLHLNLRPLGEGLDEQDADNGDAFLAWLQQSEQEEEEAPIQPIFSSIENALAGLQPKVEPKKQMMIITPNGITRYEWTHENEIPRQVADGGAFSSNGSSQAGSSNPWKSSGNVYSGYGGYSPTYPTSTTPQPAATGPQSAEVNEESGDRVSNQGQELD